MADETTPENVPQKGKAKAKPEAFTSPKCRISAKRDQFWRGGHVHTAEAQEHEEGKFSESQWAAITAEPMLVVELID